MDVQYTPSVWAEGHTGVLCRLELSSTWAQVSQAVKTPGGSLTRNAEHEFPWAYEEAIGDRRMATAHRFLQLISTWSDSIPPPLGQPPEGPPGPLLFLGLLFLFPMLSLRTRGVGITVTWTWPRCPCQSCPSASGGKHRVKVVQGTPGLALRSESACSP